MLHARKDYQERIQDSANLIPEDEPVFLLRAQDMLAPATVGFWADMAEQAGAEANIVQAARDHVRAMQRWQEDHGSKSPDMPE
jgi:hypothetical protein